MPLHSCTCVIVAVVAVMTILPLGVWGVGLAAASVRLDTVPLGNDQHSWVFSSDGTTLHNGEVISQLLKKPVEGDIVVSCEVEMGSQ